MFGIEAVGDIGVADIADNLPCDVLRIVVRGCRDFTGDDSKPGCYQRFTSDSTERVCGENGI